MSHGSAGSLTLGSATLGQGQLDSYRTSCALGATRWPNRATSCSTAATWPPASGVAFVDSLSAITRADVAAATHTVGSAALGGDWVLDYRHGAIEATTLTVARWDGVMATSTGVQTGGSTLVGVATNDKLVAYGSGNTFVFNNSSTAATTTIELRQGMKQENGVWVRNQTTPTTTTRWTSRRSRATSPPSSATTTATRSATPRSTPTTTGPSARSTWCSSRPTAARA